MGDGAAEREVRWTDAMDWVSVNANLSRCLTCRMDRQKVSKGCQNAKGPFLISAEQCNRKEPTQARCDRCLEYDYVCAIDDGSAPTDGKRRKLQRLKCEACRSAKVKVNS